MVNAVRIYGWLGTALLPAVVLGGMALFVGVSQGYLPPWLLPAGPTAAAAAFGIVIGGIVILGLLRRRAWVAAGRSLGLSPDPAATGLSGALAREPSSSLPASILPMPDLSGTVHGRAVSVETYKRRSGPADSTGRGTYDTHTVVTAELDEPVGSGVVIGRTDDDPEAVSPDVVPGPEDLSPVEDGFATVRPESEPYAAQVLDEPTRERLRGVDADGLVVGDPTDAVLAGLPEDGLVASLAGGDLAESVRAHPAFDPTTVALKTEEVVAGSGALRRQAEAVAAVADRVDAVEDAPPGP